MQIRRILFPTDFAETATRALDRAVALASRCSASLRIFHVESTDGRSPHTTEEQRQAMLDRVAYLRARATDGGGQPPTLPVELATTVASSVFDAIMDDIADYRPDLVMMGTHGGGVMIGSLAERVVGHAPCSVLVARGHARGAWPMEPGRIVVPVDFSTHSRRALDAARTLAFDDAPIVLLHVVDDPRRPEPYAEVVPSPFDVDPGLPDRIADRLRLWAEGPVSQVVVVQGETKPTLLHECDQLDAALVVIGTRGLHSFPDTMLGSTAERLSRRCGAPVLTVR